MTAPSLSSDPARLQPFADYLPPVFLDSPAQSGHLGRFLHYEVIELLGRGDNRLTLKVFDEVLNLPLAVQVLTPPLAADPTARRCLLLEARAGAAVTHENVVAIHAV